MTDTKPEPFEPFTTVAVGIGAFLAGLGLVVLVALLLKNEAMRAELIELRAAAKAKAEQPTIVVLRD